MFIFAPFAYPFVYLFKWLSEFFLFISNKCYWIYDKLLWASIRLNDITELNIWPKE